MPGGEHERNDYTVRGALKVSSNRAAAQLLQQVGVTTAIYYAQRLGIASRLPIVPSLALGTGEVTLLELDRGLRRLRQPGLSPCRRLVRRVEDQTGATICSASSAHGAISEATAYLMSSMLADVVGAAPAASARHGFQLPAAGKTGTTDDYADAWFIGYTPRPVDGRVVRLDQPADDHASRIRGTVAAPAWAGS